MEAPYGNLCFFEFPTDPNTYSIDQQFLIGKYFLVSPVLTEGASYVTAYFPSGLWYDYYSGVVVDPKGTAKYQILQAPITYIPLHIRGGGIIPFQQPALTTAETRKNNFALIAALDLNNFAEGAIYLDDGSSISVGDNYLLTSFVISNNMLVSTAVHDGYNTSSILDSIVIYGVNTYISTVVVNGIEIKNFLYTDSSKVLSIFSLKLIFNEIFFVIWY